MMLTFGALVMCAVGAPVAFGQAPPVVPEGAPRQAVETVAGMLEAAPPEDGTYFVVAGYHRPDDGGGGVFLYRKAAEEAPDGGTILEPRGCPGRLKRVFDPEGEVYAEWFGAYGDGDSAEPHDDQAAINACLARFGRVRLLAKTYGVRGKPAHYDPNVTYHAIDLGPWYRIEGADREATRIKLLDGTNPKGNSPGDNYFVVISNRDFYESADYCIVRDLTVDSNFDGQDRRSTIHAIHIRGGGALVERVNLRGYGTGWHPESGNSRECFVVAQTLVYKDVDACRRAATFRDLDFTDCGHNGDLAGNVAEITHIGIGGACNFDDLSWITRQGKDPEFDPADGGENERNWWPSYGGLVESCVIHDEIFDPATQKSPLNGITWSNCLGLTVRHNRVTNFEGTAVFVMSWWDRYTAVLDNEFRNVAYGVALQCHGQDGAPVQWPRHENILVERNHIVLGSPQHSQWGTTGIQLYGQEVGEGIRLKDIAVRGNTVEGRAYDKADGQRVYPAGINVQIVHANYQHLVIEDNTIDTPDYPEGVSHIPPEPYSLSLRYYPLARWEEDAKSGNVVFRNNRGPDGRRLYPILADWYFKNPPRWGKPVPVESVQP